MSLQSIYQRFLATQSADALAADACLAYVPTTTIIKDAPAIAKHFLTQSKLVKKKAEKVLNVVEGGNALTLEMETTLEFMTGGGTYLLNLDDNFLSDRVVTMPVVSAALTHKE